MLKLFGHHINNNKKSYWNMVDDTVTYTFKLWYTWKAYKPVCLWTWSSGYIDMKLRIHFHTRKQASLLLSIYLLFYILTPHLPGMGNWLN